MAELAPNEVAVLKTEYNSLVRDSENLKGLQTKQSAIEEAKENQKIAMEKAQKELSDFKKDSKIDLSKKEEVIKTIKDKLWLNEDDNIVDKLEELTSNDTKYQEIVKKESEKRAETITWYEKLLWEEFMESKKDLFENLDDTSKEGLLKEFIDLKGLSTHTTPQVKVATDEWNKPNTKNTSKFDEVYNNWWSSDDLISTLVSD